MEESRRRDGKDPVGRGDGSYRGPKQYRQFVIARYIRVEDTLTPTRED